MVSPRHVSEVTFHAAAVATADGVVFAVDRMGIAAVQVTGAFVAEVFWEGSLDGTNYIAIEGVNLTNGTKATSVTAAGIYRIPVIGLSQFRTRLVWTSGTSMTVVGVFADFNTIGLADVTLASNSGVDIGDVDVLSIAPGNNNIGDVDVASIAANPGVNIGDVVVSGQDAENAPVTADPVLVAGRYDASDRTLGSGDVGGLALDVHGHTIVRPNAGAVAQADGVSNTANVETDESDATILRSVLGHFYNGTTWDRMRGTVATGQVVAARLIDESGTPYGVKHVGNKPRVSAMPYAYDIAEGNIANHTLIHILGSNDDTSAAREDLWEGHGGSGTNARIPHPAVGGIQMEIVSSSNADSDSGGINPQSTGVRTVTIFYLDQNFAEQSETITMDGTTPINTTATDILRVQSMCTATVGSGGQAAGTITLESTDSAVEYCRIRAGGNVSFKGEWTVPAGMVMFVTTWQASAIAAAANRRSEFFLEATTTKDGVLTADIFHVKDILHLTASSQAFPFTLPLKIPAQADIKVSVLSSASMETSIRIEGWYETA